MSVKQSSSRFSVGRAPAGRLPDVAHRYPVALFLLAALGIGWAALGVALLGSLPLQPFLLVATFVGLFGTAVAVTAFAEGRSGVRRLLGGLLRWRIGWTRALLVLAGMPVTTLAVAALTGTLVSPQDGWGRLAVAVAVEVLLWGTLLINLWEETAWAGFLQRRLMDRHGMVVGSVLTAVPFAALHLPLLLGGGPTAGEVLAGAGGLLVLALLFRFLAGMILLSTGGSLLAVGVLHASFNSAGGLDAVNGTWQRDAALVILTAAVAVTYRVRRRRTPSARPTGHEAIRPMSATPSAPSDRREQLQRFRAGHPVRHVQVGATRWQYLVGGSGHQVVLYLPGGTGQADASFTYLTALETDHRIVSVTYPQVATLDELTAGLVAVLDAERITTAAVWGTSFGGMVAQLLVRRAPTRVTALILANTAAPSPARARKAAAQLRVLRWIPGFVLRALLRVAFVRQLGGLDPRERAFWRAYVEETFLPDAKPATLNLTRLGLQFYRRRFVPDDLDGWPGRVLILHAKDDELYREMHQPLNQLYPRGTVRTFPGGHAASLAQADRYVTAVRAFLSRPDSTAS